MSEALLLLAQAWRKKVAQHSVRPRNARHSAQHLLLTTGAQLSGHVTATAGTALACRTLFSEQTPCRCGCMELCQLCRMHIQGKVLLRLASLMCMVDGARCSSTWCGRR